MVRRFALLILVLASLTVTGFAQQSSAAQTATPQPAPPKTHLKVGQPAPEFTLTDTEGKEVKLSDFKGNKNIVLAFYVLAFTGG